MSGRTHQIRVHAKWIGTPLVGDPMYGDGEPLVVDGEVLIARYPLHSAEISFRHPTKDEPITIRAPLPEDMKTAIARKTFLFVLFCSFGISAMCSGVTSKIRRQRTAADFIKGETDNTIVT